MPPRNARSSSPAGSLIADEADDHGGCEGIGVEYRSCRRWHMIRAANAPQDKSRCSEARGGFGYDVATFSRR
jgi:hypothetical protein